MKTAEEKATEYAEREIPIAYTDEMQTVSLTGLRKAAKIDYLAGYAEAMRWRDPKEELPENVGLYLCKCEKELGFYFDIVFFNKVWRSDNVIGWRPIE